MLVFTKWSMTESGNTTIPLFPRAWDKRSLIIWYWSCTIATWKAGSKRHFIFKGDDLRWTRCLYNATIQCYLWMQFSPCEYSHWQFKPGESFLSSLPIRGSEKGQLLHSFDLTFVSFAWPCWYRYSISDESSNWNQPVDAALYLSVYWHEPSPHKYHS